MKDIFAYLKLQTRYLINSKAMIEKLICLSEKKGNWITYRWNKSECIMDLDSTLGKAGRWLFLGSSLTTFNNIFCADWIISKNWLDHTTKPPSHIKLVQTVDTLGGRSLNVVLDKAEQLYCYDE